jgi:hypothetical protein
MTTSNDRKRALPEMLTRAFRALGAAAALTLLTAAGLSCAPQQEAPSDLAPAPSPDGTVAMSPATGAEGATTAGAPPPAAPAPVEPAAGKPAEPPPPASPPAPREPVMEWQEGSKQPADEGESTVGGKHVFTNADLARFAKPEDAAHNDDAAADRKAQEAFDKSAAKKIQDQPATDAWRAKTKADAEERVRAAEARLDALRRLSQSDSNPLLPQPILSPEQEKKREGLSAEQRYKLTQQEIQQAEKELADAKANLATVLRNLASPR